MDNIFDTKQSVLMAYTPGSSGKFLINCLAFHSKCQPQTLPIFDNHNYQMQFITSKLESFVKHNQPHEWDDLNMGDREFFNSHSYYHTELNDTSIKLPNLYRSVQERIIKQADKNVIPCIEKNKFFFKEVHGPAEISLYSTVWPNRKLIIITDPSDYIILRYSENSPKRKKIKAWGEEFTKIDYSNIGSYTNFNCISFLNWLTFYQEYVKLLAYLGLEPENIDALKHFYTTYITFWFPSIDTKI